MANETIEDCVLVAGAGAGGLATALAVARRGIRVVLVERSNRLGGTVSRSLIHTIAGLFDSEGEFLNEGLPIELTERLTKASPHTSRRRMGRVWVLNVAPDIYESVVNAWIREESLVELVDRAQIGRLGVQSERVTSVEIAKHDQSTLLVKPKAVVDATGQAEIPRNIRPDLVHYEGNAAAGLVFTLSPVDTSVVQFPRNIELLREIREAARRGELPAACGKAWLDNGVRDDEVYVKLFLPMTTGWQDTDAQRAMLNGGLRQQESLVEFLKQFPAFADAAIGRTGELGVRDGGRVSGNYLLTVEDVRNLRKFEDPAANCAWPIEYWDPDKGVQLEYLAKGGSYQIPLGSLQVKGWKNLWVAGKSLCADAQAQASARVAGCCWAMGQSVGQRIVDEHFLGGQPS